MKCIVIAASAFGEESAKHLRKEIKSSKPFIVCADGGYQNAKKAGAVPDLVVGDFDSLELSFIDEKIPIVKYPPEKDYTDTKLAIDEGFKRGCTKFSIYGAIGGRLDHTFANVCLLDYILDRGGEGTLIQDEGELFIKRQSFELSQKIGTTISFFPINGRVSSLTLEGLKYPLKDYTLEGANPIGISNVFIKEKIKVIFDQGELLCYIPYKI